MVGTRSFERSLLFACALACGAGVAPARAEERATAQSATIGPGSSAGTRRIDAPTPGASAASPRPSPGPSAAKAAPPAPSHRRGRAPKEPRTTLPEGVPLSPPSLSARHGIAQGPLASEAFGGPADPELTALHQAELVLFPRPLVGLTPGWSWELPAPLDDSSPVVSADGAPPGGPAPAPEGTTDPGAADLEWLNSLTLPNLPVRLDPRVVKYLKFYRDNPQGKAIAKVWVKKSGRLAPALRAKLAEAGMPTDLVWLSLIESGHNPAIRSPAGAAGLWQFIPESARLYGLVVDRWVDERLDPERSTEAALLYLSDLYQRFGSWDLAMAGYNMGHGGLSRAIAKYNTNDFWELSRHEAGIPWETTLYVPKILATAIVMNNKKAFGLDGITPDPALSFDTVRVSPGTPLSRIAAAAEVSVAVVEAHNAQYLADRVPPEDGKRERWTVALPKGTGLTATRKLAKAAGNELEPYRVRFGDTLATIAASGGTSEDRLRELNALQVDELLDAGTVLLLPRVATAGGGATRGGEKPVIVVAPAQYRYAARRQLFYDVRRGDRLESVAAAFGVEPAEIVLWNSLADGARLQPGMALQIFAPSSHSLDAVRHVRAEDARLLVVGSPEFFDHFEGLKGKQRMVVAAQEGDNLGSIGERYGMTIGWMERVNRRSRRDPVEVGEPIVVYAPRGTAPTNPVASASTPSRSAPTAAAPKSAPRAAAPAERAPTTARADP